MYLVCNGNISVVLNGVAYFLSFAIVTVATCIFVVNIPQMTYLVYLSVYLFIILSPLSLWCLYIQSKYFACLTFKYVHDLPIISAFETI